MTSLPERRHLEVLSELVPLAGRSVLDIGCGDGTLLRALMEHDPEEAVGLESSPRLLQRALAAEPLDDLLFLPGSAEALDFPAASFDLVIFFKSLHHVPPGAIDQALSEAHRVLRDEGRLYVAEPLAQGSNFALTRTFGDETRVRRVAHERLKDAAKGAFEQLEELFYDAPVRYADFEAFRRSMKAVDPARAALLRLDEDLRQVFEQLGEQDGKTYRFSQPMRVNLLQPRRKARGLENDSSLRVSPAS